MNDKDAKITMRIYVSLNNGVKLPWYRVVGDWVFATSNNFEDIHGLPIYKKCGEFLYASRHNYREVRDLPLYEMNASGLVATKYNPRFETGKIIYTI